MYSFGKAFNATGWKVGYRVAAPAITAHLRKVHQYLTFSVSTPMQHAVAGFLGEQPGYCDALAAFYQERRDRLARLLAGSRLRLTPATGIYFQLANYSAISDLPDAEFCKELTTRDGVAAIPLSPFCETPLPARLVRFCFAKDDATLAEAADRLGRI